MLTDGFIRAKLEILFVIAYTVCCFFYHDFMPCSLHGVIAESPLHILSWRQLASFPFHPCFRYSVMRRCLVSMRLTVWRISFGSVCSFGRRKIDAGCDSVLRSMLLLRTDGSDGRLAGGRLFVEKAFVMENKGLLVALRRPACRKV